MSCSRRALVRRLLQDLGAGVGLILHRSLPPALAAEEESARNQTGPLTVRVTRPFDAETPVREFTSFLTPNHRFFVRSHFGPPPAEAVAGERPAVTRCHWCACRCPDRVRRDFLRRRWVRPIDELDRTGCRDDDTS